MQLKSPFFGEFMGTMMMILLGDGVVAGVLLKRSKAENSGWIVITAGWCFAVMAGIYTAIACGSSDAHLNPAITLGAAVVSGDYSKLISYVPAQMLGAFVGAILVWLQFLPHWKETPDVDLKRACFCTAPAIQHRSQPAQRNYRHFRSGFCGRGDLLKGGSIGNRPDQRARSLLSGKPGLGNWPFARRNHRLRDQSGS